MRIEHRSLAGVEIRTLLADGLEDRFAELFPALAASPVGVEAPELEIRLSLGAPSNELIDRARTLDPRFHHGRTRALADGDDLILTEGASLVFVRSRGATIEAMIDPCSLEDGYTFAHTTLFIALMIALRSRGRFHLHAGAVVDSIGRTILIAGEGGAGKTTVTLALLRAGADQIGDDTILISADGAGAPLVNRVPKPFHADEGSLAAFPGLGPFVGQAYRENRNKRAFDAAAAFPGKVKETAGAPFVLLFPEIADREHTILAPMSEADAMGALTASSALVVVEGMAKVPEQLSLMRRIAEGAIARRALLGRDLLRDPLGFARTIEGLGK